MRKLIFPILMLLVSTVLLSTASFAWFSMSTRVSAVNMNVKATTDSSMVISASTNFTAGSVEVSKSGINVVLRPATRYVSTMLDDTTEHDPLTEPETGLAYVSNTTSISTLTGLALEGRTLYYAGVDDTLEALPDGTAGLYYDFVFYLAAEGSGSIAHGSLVMTIPALNLSEFDPTEKILNAVAVLPLVNDTIAGDPVYLKDGCSNYELVANLATTPVPGGAPGEVPGAVKVTLRTYLDGALKDTETTTYVKNVDIVDLTRSVSFNAVFEAVSD